MKKKVGIISVLLVIVLVVILAILLTNKKKNEPLDIATSDSSIAYYYQNGSSYTQGTSSTWTTGYVLNVGKSSCNGTTNPKDILDWDSVNKKVLMSANENNNCKLYFDKVTQGQTYTAEEFFTTFTSAGDKGELIKHESSLLNSAGDNGYRYSGNNPNNFICFGPGSSDYNNGISGANCEDENLYRIIGYVPVELPDGTKENRIKVIKSEYATASDLGISSNGTPSSDSKYTSLARVKKLPENGFKWDNNNNNIWGSSSLYQALNTNSNSFLNKLGNWANKIENVKWNVGGYTTYSITAKGIYDGERSSSYGAKTKVPAKIGLMYPSDYGFASNKEHWTINLFGYDKDSIRQNNWLFNAVYEWTISRHSNNTVRAFLVAGGGYVSNGTVDNAYGVRPVFYLNSSVTLSDGEGIDGSQSKPFKVS